MRKSGFPKNVSYAFSRSGVRSPAAECVLPQWVHGMSVFRNGGVLGYAPATYSSSSIRRAMDTM